VEWLDTTALGLSYPQFGSLTERYAEKIVMRYEAPAAKTGAIISVVTLGVLIV